MPSPHKNYAPNVANFFAALKAIAVDVGQGSYAFTKPGGGCLGFAQFIIESDRKLTFHRLWTREPGNGNGSMMLRALCDLADQHGVELALKVIPIGRKPYPMSREQLKTWYQRYGFEGLRWKMIRKPGARKSHVLRLSKVMPGSQSATSEEPAPRANTAKPTVPSCRE